jgi:hypothetical protein
LGAANILVPYKRSKHYGISRTNNNQEMDKNTIPTGQGSKIQGRILASGDEVRQQISALIFKGKAGECLRREIYRS